MTVIRIPRDVPRLGIAAGSMLQIPLYGDDLRQYVSEQVGLNADEWEVVPS